MATNDKYPEDLFKLLHDKVMEEFTSSDLYQSKFRDQKVSISQLYGRGTYKKELPHIRTAIHEKTQTRLNEEWLYKRSLECKKNPKGDFNVSSQSEPFYDALANYIGYEDFKAFVTAHLLNVQQVIKPVTQSLHPQGSDTIANLAGLYEAYIILPETQTLSVLVVLLTGEGEVQIRSKMTAIDRNYKGSLKPVPHSRILLGEFELSEHDFDKHKYYKYFFVLQDRFETKSPWPQGVITGVYAGKGKRSEDPMAGRIRLYRIRENHEGIQADFKTHEPKEILLKDPNLFDKIRDKKELIPFFMGNRDDFMESVALFEDLALIEKTHWIEGLKRISGCYYCYTLSSDRTYILERPVCIQPNGFAEMRLPNPPIGMPEEIKYKGRAVKLREMFLSIRFHTRTDERQKPYPGFFLFYSTDAPRSEIKRMFGTFTSANDRNQPLAGRAILIPVEGAFHDLTSRAIPLFSEAYYDLDHRQKGLLRFLTGDANNLIKSFRDIDSPFEKEQDYADMYFGAACYKAQTNPKKAAELMGYAFMHGFKDWKKLHQEKTSGFLQSLSNEDWEHAKEFIAENLWPTWNKEINHPN